MNWNEFRREDGSIDLVAAYDSMMFVELRHKRSSAISYLKGVETLEPVVSRQVAATALVSAAHYAVHRASPWWKRIFL